ncbi:triose-phosphate transporter family-domain-containing protein [Haematococcus lacustris]
MSTDDSQRRSGGLWRPDNIKAVSYGLLNVVTASGIVFANKYVFTTCRFRFTYALTWIHTLFTLLGMTCFARCGMFETKKMPAGRLAPLAAAYVAYIVLCNLSLNVNTVGFYQVMKIAVAPTVILLEFIMFRRLPHPRVVAAVLLVCLGIAVATVTDSQMVRNLWGIWVGLAATLMTALYQIWAGSKQKELKASSMQLLHAYTPLSALMLGVLVPMFEPMGWTAAAAGAAAAGGGPGGSSQGGRSPSDTLLGYEYSWGAAAAILLSSALGLGVSLSTFLVIGATSSLTYNVVGHLKTLIILTGGCMFFGDQMPPKKLLGVGIAMAGIVWYTQLKLASSDAVGLPGPGAATGPSQPVSSTALQHHQPQAATPNGTRTVEKGRLGAADPSNPLRGGGLEEGLASRSAFTAVHISSRPRQGTTPRS